MAGDGLNLPLPRVWVIHANLSHERLNLSLGKLEIGWLVPLRDYYSRTVCSMKRRELLRRLIGIKELTRFAKDNWLTSCRESDLRTLCNQLSDLYDGKPNPETLRQGASWLARLALNLREKKVRTLN